MNSKPRLYLTKGRKKKTNLFKKFNVQTTQIQLIISIGSTQQQTFIYPCEKKKL